MLGLLVRPPTCLYQILVVMLWVFPSCRNEKLFMRSLSLLGVSGTSLDVLIVLQDNFQQIILTKQIYINVKMQKHDENWNL